MTTKQAVRKKSVGFTIIEVILVLAIAGLIFLVVFLAIRSAQIAARDNQRKSAAMDLLNAAVQWHTNKPGATITTDAKLQTLITEKYFKRQDPSTGNDYALVFYDDWVHHDAIPPPAPGEMAYVEAHICDTNPGDNIYIMHHPNYIYYVRMFAILVTLENGTVYCVDSE
ncbi:MAG TPA: type II secretion system protein [Candidatus Saccharimonadales bacterium]|nr:type II secretion system protein [Candidatus Saccharimonadales bacterium]